MHDSSLTPAHPAGADSHSERRASVPLCVDLDGTLVMVDLFVEQLAARVLRFRGLGSVARAAMQGRAALKRHLAATESLDASTLPYRQDFVDWLRAEHLAGRRIVLVTAADESIAARVAAHVGVFDEVLASDGTRNLKSRVKGAELCARFGPQGFVYAGDSRADLAVWKHAKSAVLVGTSRSVAEAVARLVPIEARFGGGSAPSARAFVRAIRPTQWVKNFLVFVPTLMSRSYGDGGAWLRTGTVFLAFCALASSVYLLNDFLDLTSDRAHPQKRNRPLAAGTLAAAWALPASAVLLAIGLLFAGAAGAILPAALYAALTFAYSSFLKELQLVDIFTLTALYAIRVVAGGVASGYEASVWLLAFSGFLFLALASMKRTAELRARETDGAAHNNRRAYELHDIRYLEMFGMASSMTSALVLTLFVETHMVANDIANPLFLLAVVPAVLFWQARLWLATSRGYMHEDPILYAIRDWVTRTVASMILALFVLSGLAFMPG